MITTNIMLEPTAEEMSAATMKAADLEAKIFKDAYKREYAEHLHESRHWCHQRDTIRLLRREVRRLKRELKSKDRAMFAQKSFYEAMLDDVQKREGTSKESVEEWFNKMLLRTIKSLETTYGVNQ